MRPEAGNTCLSKGLRVSASAVRPAFILLTILLAVQRPLLSQGGAATTSYSIPVSPSVVATVVLRDEQLVMLVLWRGSARWYSTGSHRGGNSGFAQDGTVRVSLQYGDVSADLSLDPAAHTATVQGRANSIPSKANALLIDGIGRGRSGQLVKAFYFDPADANLDLRRGSLAPLLARSREIVAYLQCDAFPDQVKSADPCATLTKR